VMPQPRYCKKCKAVFADELCAGGHPNFFYLKNIPKGVAVPEGLAALQQPEEKATPAWKLKDEARKTEVAERQSKEAAEAEEKKQERQRRRSTSKTKGKGKKDHEVDAQAGAEVASEPEAEPEPEAAAETEAAAGTKATADPEPEPEPKPKPKPTAEPSAEPAPELKATKEQGPALEAKVESPSQPMIDEVLADKPARNVAAEGKGKPAAEGGESLDGLLKELAAAKAAVKNRDAQILALQKQAEQPAPITAASSGAPVSRLNILPAEARVAGPESVKPAMAQLTSVAKLDARFKAALKRDATGDAKELQTLVHALVICIDALQMAVGATGVKDNVKGVLGKKLASTCARLDELQPLISKLGVRVLSAAEAAGADKPTTTPTTAHSAGMSELGPSTPLAPGTPTGGQAILLARFEAALTADGRLKNHPPPSGRHPALLAETIKKYKAAESAISDALKSPDLKVADVGGLEAKAARVAARLQVRAGQSS
jgi:hypothetical protein